MNRTIESGRDWRSHWNTVGQRHASDALFAQVERTIGGQPVAFEQVRLLVQAIREALAFVEHDIALDLCCGNGLLTIELSPFCRSLVAVDYSLELIEVARQHHAAPNIVYLSRAAEELAPADFPDGPPTKICMNAGLQYFTEPQVQKLLETLARITADGATLYFTDVPDAERIFVFYNSPERRAEFERRRAARTEAIGTWWSRPHLEKLFESAGYSVSFVDLDARRSTSHYRYDVLARRVDPSG
jgi:ubiquinone/menaquinone biosynthesis C-methylase UbiE